MRTPNYTEKLAGMAPRTLLPLLGQEDAAFVRRIAETYRLTYQELRLVSQAARDLEMWQESRLGSWWEETEAATQGTGRLRKKTLLGQLEEHIGRLAAAEKTYSEDGGVQPRRQVRLEAKPTDRQVLGSCPAYSDQTVCCGLHTLDAVRGCPFSCSYCTIQTFYGDTAELESDLLQKLVDIELDPARRYHIGTGQASDSLVWGNREGILDALVGFAQNHPNVLLELKTKSDNVDGLRDMDIPPNLVCSWTLNTQSVIRTEEKGTASLERRLRAARKMADVGVPVSFHFHPMVYYQGWDTDYPALAEQVLKTFSPPEVAFISMGSVTLIKPVIQEIRRRGGATKILQMEMVPDHHGKLTYPDDLKIRLFRTLYSSFATWSEEVLFYLCMETSAIWREVFGVAYSTNAEFESDFLDRCLVRSPEHLVDTQACRVRA